ncbi:MAG TPA: helicase HerA-like domain-containing protein [Solirubrobacteraceae bacterium]|nr:helicase HerA-like domain-containing protein [Solirubrobacteraceae bacterium]
MPVPDQYVSAAVATATTAPPLPPLSPPLDLLGQLGLGALAGCSLAALLRRRQLHWSWALLVLVGALSLRPLLAGSFAPLATAAVVALVRARGRHREDLAWGGDLYELAQARRGPLQCARTALFALLERRGAGYSGQVLGDELVAVGRDRQARLISVPFSTRAGRHTLIVGATGSGKTVTQTWIVCRAIEAGLSAVVIDPKGDPHMRSELAQSARRAGRELLSWTPGGPHPYNPFGYGTPSEIADRVLAAERFTEPHYQRQAQRYLAFVLRALQGADVPASLSEIVRRLEPESLLELCELLPASQAEATGRYLETLTARQRTDLSGVRDRLAILAESDVAAWLEPEQAGHGAFDLLGAIRRRAVVHFELQADSWPLLAQMLGVAIVGDLRAAMAALQRSPVPAVVAIDEFAAIAAEQVAHLFGRARSAGINLLLGTQELSDLRVEGRGQLREQVLGNLSSVIAHRQVVCESAELVSRLAGSRGAWRTAQSPSGWTRSRTSAPVLSAERVRSLPVGHAAVLDLTRGTACVAGVFSGRAR